MRHRTRYLLVFGALTGAVLLGGCGVPVPVTVNLTEPVGDRTLVDGVCLGLNAVPATNCGEDDCVRWAVSEPSASAIWRLPKGEEVSPVQQVSG